jgi:hypothetical protein
MDAEVVRAKKHSQLTKVTVRSEQPMSRFRTNTKVSLTKSNVSTSVTVTDVRVAISGTYEITVEGRLPFVIGEGDAVTLSPGEPPAMGAAVDMLAKKVQARPPIMKARAVPVDVLLGAVTPSA